MYSWLHLIPSKGFFISAFCQKKKFLHKNHFSWADPAFLVTAATILRKLPDQMATTPDQTAKISDHVGWQLSQRDWFWRAAFFWTVDIHTFLSNQMDPHGRSRYKHPCTNTCKDVTTNISSQTFELKINALRSYVQYFHGELDPKVKAFRHP